MTVLDEPQRREPPHPVLWFLIGTMVVLRALEAGAEIGLAPQIFGWAAMQSTFGFFDVYFDAALSGQPHPTQLYTSFATHAFLHGGWLHLAMNGGILLAIGHGVCRTAGPWALLIIFFISTVAGAATLGLMVDTPAVLIGASGGVFGLLGAMLARRAQTLVQTGRRATPVWRMVGALVLAHVLIVFGFENIGDGRFAGGIIAWQSHLGGFVAGWLVARFFNRAEEQPEGRPFGWPR